MVGVSALALVEAVAAVAVSPAERRRDHPAPDALALAHRRVRHRRDAGGRPGRAPGVAQPARWAPAAAVATALAVSAATLPTHVSDGLFTSPTVDAEAYLPRGRELVGDLDELAGRGNVLYDPTGLPFADPYSGLVWAELQDRDVPFVFDDEVLIRHFGESRRPGGPPSCGCGGPSGPRRSTPHPGAERIGFAEGPTGPVALLVEPIAGRRGPRRRCRWCLGPGGAVRRSAVGVPVVPTCAIQRVISSHQPDRPPPIMPVPVSPMASGPALPGPPIM